jgi:hypothetical protein
MDGEVNALVESLRAGASRLAGDLAAVEAGMGELYDAASGRGGHGVEASPSFGAELQYAIAAAPAHAPAPAPAPAPAFVAQEEDAVGIEGDAPGGDLDGARLIALNMALNGESRADTERYLAENFQLPDRLGLIDEVYAAIEG